MKFATIMPMYVHNRYIVDVIQRCLGSYHNTCDAPLYLVDDHSPLKLFDMIEPTDNDQKRVIYRTSGAQGYTATVNEGLSALLGKYDAFVIANDDLEFTPFWHVPLMFSLNDPAVGIAALSTTDDVAGSDRFGSIWAVRSDTVKKVGLLDPKMKHFFSDLDYYKRMKKKNLKIDKQQSIRLPHIGSATYGKNHQEIYQDDMEAFRSKYGTVE